MRKTTRIEGIVLQIRTSDGIATATVIVEPDEFGPVRRMILATVALRFVGPPSDPRYRAWLDVVQEIYEGWLREVCRSERILTKRVRAGSRPRRS